VQVSDGGQAVVQALAVTVTPVNDNAPRFTSDGGAADVSVVVSEGERWSVMLSATDADLPAQGLVFAISGGADAALFDLDPTSGLLRFTSMADQEAPQDANRDNAYEVVVVVGDGEQAAYRRMVLLIANVNEAPVLLSSQVSVGQGRQVVLDAGMLQSADPDTEAAALVYTVSDVQAGVFVRVGAPDQAIDQFTQAEVLAGQVAFVQSGDNIAATRFDLVVSDGGFRVGPHRVTVQVQPTDSTPTPEIEWPAVPSLVSGLQGLVTGGLDGGVRLDPITLEPAGSGADGVSTASRLDVVAAGEGQAAVESSPWLMHATQRLVPRATVMPDLPQELRLTPRVRAEAAVGTADLTRLPASDLLVMLDAPIDLSGFEQEQVALLRWSSFEERSRAAVESARQQQSHDRAPVLQWDSGRAVQAGGMALSVGLVFWATRASGLIASLAAVAPPWRQFDPLPVLSVHAPRQPDGAEVEWLDTDISGSLAALAEDILDHQA
jgi:hypothetical protein